MESETAMTPQEVALWLLRDFGNVQEADALSMNRLGRARRDDRKQHWYEVNLWVWRLSTVRGGP